MHIYKYTHLYAHNFTLYVFVAKELAVLGWESARLFVVHESCPGVKALEW